MEIEATGRRRIRWNGWRMWTVLLLLLGAFAGVMTYYASPGSETKLVWSQITSVCGGAAFVSGFLWKLMGEHTLVLIDLKDQMIVTLQKQHASDIAEHQITIGNLTKEVERLSGEIAEIKRLNLMLQTSKIGLEEQVSRLRQELEQERIAKTANAQKVEELEQTLRLAERRLAINK